MKITVDINENEILNAADEMIAAADELGRKAWRLKHLIEGKEVSMSEKRREGGGMKDGALGDSSIIASDSSGFLGRTKKQEKTAES